MIKKIDKQDRILDSATYVLARNPSASLNAIADASGIGIATLHRHFNNRDELLLILAQRGIEALNKAMSEIDSSNLSPKEHLSEIINVYIPLGDKIIFLIYDPFINQNKDILQQEQKIKDLVESIIKNMQKDKTLDNNTQSLWMLNVLYALIITAWEQIEIGNISKNHASNLVLNNFLNGFHQ